MSERFALYFAPCQSSSLSRFGETVLGRSALSARTSETISTFPDQARWRSLTTSPAHYGFHATLKAPFELQKGMSADQLRSALTDFAQQQTAIPLHGLGPRRLSHFIALTVDKQPDALTQLAQACVETFEPFRAPLDDKDMKRRLASNLTERQQALLSQFGYPYVAEQFRFHMTLSGALTDSDGDFEQWLAQQYSDYVKEVPVIDRIALYYQPDRETPFIRQAEFTFV